MVQIGLLEEVRKKLGMPTDYGLAKALGIPVNRIYDYLKGKRVIDDYCCFKIAEILGKDPVQIIASVLAEDSKNPVKAMYFKHFLTTVGLWIILAVIPVSFVGFSNDVQAHGKEEKTVKNQHNGSLCEVMD